ncbi:Gfo/Idh/MocA family oxidoreductase [Caulobacter sp. NIBR1757]|uniref:Gfo/Idh/MocA family protein n=1 Tax=Caulobacter sp. NIBR1757 TaxID=3016000 RepID=UPI0022F056FA|nr:Gfo/Idh/MocA family oxidoreductase [Caulobacter sp. NIBR1757]WGM39163.1 Inositol 2-dehydrogenase/D-chiro-inositol 3-dehydrogenase [Caulobacter sp. NIBR1757]
MTARRLKLGMVGGGDGAFIGGVHRMAARLDGRWDLISGAFSSDPVRSQAFGRSLGLADDRCYGDWQAMARAEAARADRIDAVAIVTPNHLHHGPAKAFLEAGIAVICDKPLTTSLADALDLAEAVERAGAPFVLTHNYSGYAMVRQMRAMVAEGMLGAIRVVQAEYAQDWLATDQSGNKQADWRGDPARAGAGGALGDIATHAYHLASFVTGETAQAVSAETSRFVPGRRLDDDVQIRLRWASGARGQLWASQVAIGVANGLRLRLYGEKAALEWAQEEPDLLRYARLGEAPQLLRRGGPGLSPAAQAATRIPAGHPEGYLEGFAQIYADAADLIGGGSAPMLPGISDGVDGLRFIEAAVASAAGDGRWIALNEGAK